jgi:hypothetical protein
MPRKRRKKLSSKGAAQVAKSKKAQMAKKKQKIAR